VLKDYASEGKTILFITHRPSIMKNADKILFLKNKLIVEEGNYKDLLSKKSLFHSFINNTIS